MTTPSSPPGPFTPTLRNGYPDFLDLPWGKSLSDWRDLCTRCEEVPHGLSRHAVVFVNYDGNLYAIKELPPGLAQTEYDLLLQMENLHLPCVVPVGYGNVGSGEDHTSILITRYLEQSLPYRSLFMRSSLDRYRQHLLDAMAGLLVQLHLAGIYWGDCSLSNTLFRRDAGALQAYLVDAETAESHPPRLSPMLRHHDLQIMKENVTNDLLDLETTGHLSTNYPIQETDEYIRQRYRALWEEITREELIDRGERYRVQERIRALNALGFSVRDVAFQEDGQEEKLRFRIIVADRNFHRYQLFELTGLEAEEMQARQMMNEIQEIRAYQSQASNRPVPLSVAAHHWLEHVYLPVIARLESISNRRSQTDANTDLAELYCQVLEHKWYLSEQAHHDVGHQAAVEDYVQRFGQSDC